MKILFYDVETAQAKNVGSICAVGWQLFDNDVLVNKGYSLINPHCAFSKTNIAVHGITAVDVEDAPCFAEYWESTLKGLMTSALVIAHNAGFDLSATEQALYLAGVEDPGVFYLDSLALIKNIVKAPSYKLCDLAAMIGYEYQAHNAAADVDALAHVLFHIRDHFKMEDLAALIARIPVRAEHTKTNTFIPHDIVPETNFPVRSHCRENVEVQDGKIAGLKICITGDIEGYERADLEKLIMIHGGRAMTSVSGKTDYLVVGVYPDYGPGFISGKQKKAMEIIEQGGKIRILSPEEFFLLIGD